MSDQPEVDETVTAPEASDIEDATGADVIVETEHTDAEPGDDDNAELDLGDDDQGAPDVAPDEGKAGGIVDEGDRKVPQTAETVLHDEKGVVHERDDMAAYVWVRAHHNLPGWNLVAARYDEVDEDGKGVGDPVNADESDGWIPNNEEGVHAVELGFAEIIETPAGESPPEQ